MRKMLLSFMVVALYVVGSFAAVFQHINELTSTSYDFIIVGGGLAGSVVANRLTENPKFKVLVVEAGPTNEGVLNAVVPAFEVRLWKTAYDWNFTTIPGKGINNRTLDYPRGHMLGGCSSHNGMFYTRGSMDDYNRWADVTGDPGWSWKNLLPYFFKNERWSPPADRHDTHGQFDPSAHGYNGMMFTSLPGNPNTIDDMVLKVPSQLPDQFPFLLDLNAGRPLGLGWFPYSIGNGTRSSAATAYLSEKFTSRSNLYVLLNTKVLRVLSVIKASKPTFDSIEVDGTAIKLTASKEVILAAGPINTPQILLNSGVGDRQFLHGLGIPSVLHLPSVGKNLTDQPFIVVSYSVNSNKPQDNLNTNATLQALALAQWEFNRTGPYVNPAGGQIAWSRLPANSPIIKKYGDPSAGSNTPHLELVPSNPISLPSQPSHVGGMGIILVTPSSRGYVSINSTDPFGKPIIDFGFLTTDFDVQALIESIKLSQKFYKAPVWKDYIIEQLSPLPNATDAELTDFMRNTAGPSYHAVGTAAMSAPNANYGVVNPDLRVKGASGLRIVDGSVLPFVISAHTQAPGYAIAERASDLIKSFWK
ncbi:hypothetical protein CVT25_007112 [Psilocybe cyanescens]|uniref:pyranose dehydrogenase (acceptor) n=1 Tax=Psilocybe cyanescens TaxID=93625 RepID=A0A409WVQ8_PSICY|nr:hypothetical protein CVT25_007112 [Psilocybe cyanescens]